MAGEANDAQGNASGTPEGAAASAAEAQKLWDEVSAEREQGAAEANSADANTFTAEPEPEPGGDDTAAADAKPEPEATTKADPFAGLSPEVVARLQRLDALESQVALVPTLQRTVQEAQGRVAAMQRELDQARAAAETVKTAPTQAQIAAASQSTEKWNALKTDFPEWADATEEFVKASLSGLTLPESKAGLTPEEVEARIEARVRTALEAAERQRQHEMVADRHPAWQQTVKQPEFQTWFAAQDEATRALATSPKARDAIAMLDLFERAKQQPADKVVAERQNRLAAAVTSRPSPGAKPAGKTPEQMTPAELWEYERKQAAKRAASTGLTY